MTDTPGKWPSEAKPVPRWVTSWPDWYGVKGNVAVVPASDYDNLGRYVLSGPALDLLKEARPYLDLIRQPAMVVTQCDAAALAKRIDALLESCK